MKQPEELRGKQHIPQLQRKIKKKKIAVLPPTSYFINTWPWSQGEAWVEDMNSLTRFILPMGKQRLPFGIPHGAAVTQGAGRGSRGDPVKHCGGFGPLGRAAGDLPAGSVPPISSVTQAHEPSWFSWILPCPPCPSPDVRTQSSNA